MKPLYCVRLADAVTRAGGVHAVSRRSGLRADVIERMTAEGPWDMHVAVLLAHCTDVTLDWLMSGMPPREEKAPDPGRARIVTMGVCAEIARKRAALEMPSDTREALLQAGAAVVAEIERMDALQFPFFGDKP